MRITYETHYRSERADGRHTSTMAAFVERLRHMPSEHAFPSGIDRIGFEEWKRGLAQKVRELLKLDYFLSDSEGQPAPRLVDTALRDGYRVERWEIYPDSYSVLPMLALIPDCASEQNPVPGVMCLPGSTFSKEFMAGEPLLDIPNCRMQKYPERNKMAYYIVKAGMAAFAFDNPETAECSLKVEREGDYGSKARGQLCHGLLQAGLSYFGLSTAQKLVALDFIRRMPVIDRARLGISAHSLGCDDAMHVALLSEDIRAVVFNDFVADAKHRYYSTTEYDEREMANDSGSWHIVPGAFMSYDRTDLLCALAPRYLLLNEGGAEYYLDKIREAYAICGSDDCLSVEHYAKYKDKDSRSSVYLPPSAGLSVESYFEFTNTDAPEHSYHRETAIPWLVAAMK